MSAPRPTLRARPKVRLNRKQPLAIRPVTALANVPNLEASAADETAALVHKADQELRDLLEKLQIPKQTVSPNCGPVRNEVLSRLDSDVLVSLQAASLTNDTPNPDKTAQPEPQVKQTELVLHASAASEHSGDVVDTPIQQTGYRNIKWLTSLATAGAALALFTSVLVYHLHDGQLTNHGKALAQQNNAITKLTQDTRVHKTETEARLADLQSLVAEVKYPPPELFDAQNLMRAGLYADAEATYRNFLTRAANSLTAEVALNNAAIAAAMQNNCSMSAMYLSRLKKQFPQSPFLIRNKGLVTLCNVLRTKPP